MSKCAPRMGRLRTDGKVGDLRATDASSPRVAVAPPFPGAAVVAPGAEFEIWRNGVRQTALAHVSDFLNSRCLPQLDRTGIDIAADVLVQFVDGGKCLRSTFMYLGWLCGAGPDSAALRASAGLELLQAFALLQDDVMDDSPLRRGRAAAHVRFGEWHRERGLSGSQDRFGASLATLLSDLCLVWAEQMMRESGLAPAALARAWPHYDAMRIELAVGQIADVAHWRTLIVATGAADWIEELIADRVAEAIGYVRDDRIGDWAQSALADMALICTRRAT